jgi:hypothetical protein
MLKPFGVAVVTVIGNGEDSRFWIDHWSQVKTVAELAPNLIKIISKQAVKQWTVSQALDGKRLVADINEALTVQVLAEYILLWDLLDNFALQQNVPDQHICRLTQSGSYTSKLVPSQ